MLRTVVDLGLLHIDTSDYYGPHVVNDLIREALHPYPSGLRIVTKVGARRGDDRSWFPAMTEPELIEAVYGDLKRLDVERLDVVNLRMPDASDPDDPVQRPDRSPGRGPDRPPGREQRDRGPAPRLPGIAPVVCVQNEYNLVNRGDDDLVDICAEERDRLRALLPAGRLLPAAVGDPRRGRGRTSARPDSRTALAWLLHRSPTICVIPGTSSLAHLKENVARLGAPARRGRDATPRRPGLSPAST